MTQQPDSPLSTYRSYLRKHQLAYQYDRYSKKAVFFPKVVAPGSGQELEWKVSEGTGTVYATTYVQPKDGKAYNIALIDLAEGFRLMSRVEGISPEKVSIGMRVKIKVAGADSDEPYPIFVPIDVAHE
jgi:uncharacterized OB-fold protein